MKLSKLYSNKENFRTILFNTGVNIVFGKIRNPDNANVNCHNLGKSTLVKIIDFMLLKKLPTNSFLRDPKFQEYIFFLEIELNDGRFVTIRRAINNSKVSIKIHLDKNQNYINETEWDFLNFTIDGKYSAIKELQKLLNFDVLNNTKYRNTLTYFLRAQEDYKNPFQLSKYFKNKDSSWKPALFELLGYNGELLEKLYSTTEDIEEIEADIKRLQRHFQTDVEDLDKLKSLSEVLSTQIEELKSNADGFDFYLEEASISKDLVKNIESKVADLNVQKYQLESRIQDINESLNSNAIYNYSEVYELYEEIKLYFPDNLKCSFNELISFNEKISRERVEKLNEVLAAKQNILKKIEDDLVALNQQRVKALSRLREIESFEKFKDAQQKIIELSLRKEQIEEKISTIRFIYGLRSKEEIKIRERDTLKKKINEIIDIGTDKAKVIKNNFSKFVKEIIGCSGMLNIRTVSTGNVEFEYNTFDDDGNLTYEKDGHTYLKEICACVDLAILSSYSTQSFYKFVFHDGCVDGDDFRIATSYLNLIRRLSKDFGLQIILTIIENDFSVNEEANIYDITESEIVLELSDSEDGTGKLFGFTF